jgi:hypothetical protein
MYFTDNTFTEVVATEKKKVEHGGEQINIVVVLKSLNLIIM